MRTGDLAQGHSWVSQSVGTPTFSWSLDQIHPSWKQSRDERSVDLAHHTVFVVQGDVWCSGYSSQRKSRHGIPDKMERTVCCDSVDSWYKQESGKITNTWPDSLCVQALAAFPAEPLVREAFTTWAIFAGKCEIRYRYGVLKERPDTYDIVTH